MFTIVLFYHLQSTDYNNESKSKLNRFKFNKNKISNYFYLLFLLILFRFFHTSPNTKTYF
jgi:L-asparagine transporter-like permease